jgi:hypothetical protein
MANLKVGVGLALLPYNVFMIRKELCNQSLAIKLVIIMTGISVRKLAST